MRPQNKNNLTKLITSVIVLIVVLYGLNSSSKVYATAGVYEKINFQGKLVDSNGVNVTDGSYTVDFTLYDAANAGTDVWTEEQTVTVADGIFRVTLGTVTPFGSTVFDNDNLFLGISINSGTELSPRIRFTAAPYAMNAKKVNGLNVTNTNGTLTIPNGTTIAFSGANNLTFTTSSATNVTLPTTGTLATLAESEIFTNKTIGSTGLTFSGATTDITTPSGEHLALVPGGTGNVGIGITSPGVKLEVAGDMQLRGQGDLRLADSDSDAYAGFQAPVTVSSSYVLTLPDALPGGSSYALTSNSAGTLTWTDISGSTGDITAVGSMTSGAVFADSGAADDWLGLGPAAGRIHFTDSTNDVVSIMGGRFGVGTTSGAAIADILGTTEQLRLSYDASNYASFTTSASGDLTIAPSGNDLGLYSEVGIGTSNPTRVLDIVTANNTENMLALTNTSGNVVSFFQPNDTSGVVQFNFGTSGNTDRGRIRYQNSDDSLQLTTNDTTWLHLSSTGFVGLGTTAPSEKLNVLGAIITTNASTTDNQSGGLVGAANDDFLVGSNYINSYGFGFENPGSGLKAYMSGYYGLDFYTSNTTTPRLSVSQSGNVTIANNVSVSNQGDLRLLESGSTNYFGLQAAASMDSDDVYTWPADMPAGSNYALVSNSAGTMSWLDTASLGGGSGDISAVGSVTSGAAFADSASANGQWLGIGSGAGRIHFTDAGTDSVAVLGGRLGVGTTGPSALTDFLGTTEQLRLSYDASNYASFTTSASGDLTLAPSGADFAITGRGSISGTASTGSNGNVFTVGGTLDGTSNNQAGLLSSPYVAPSASSTLSYYGLMFIPTSDSANITDAVVGGMYGGPYIYGSSTVSTANGGTFQVLLDGSAVANQASGIRILNPSEGGTSSVTTNYGLYVTGMTAGTSDYGARIDSAETQTLWIAGDTESTAASAGIAFGQNRDVNLYRGGGNVLQTDDTFTVSGGNITVTNQGDIRLLESGSTNYFGLQAAASMDSDDVYTWPSDFPTSAGQVLSSNTAGALSWVTAGVTVRESDASPSVSSVSTIEFGPASTSTDEFIVSDETGGVVRVRTGNKVVLTDALQSLTNKTIGSTGLTFSGATTDITTGTDEALTITPNGTGDTIISIDADTNLQITASAAPGIDMVALSNASQGTTTDGVDGLSIAFTQADDADATDTNSAVNIAVTNSSGDADALRGITIAGITGGSATEYALVIGSGWDRGLDVSSAAQINSTLTATGTTTVGSSGNTFTFDPSAGVTYAGTARKTKTITLVPEYSGAVLTTFYGAGTDTSITGTMTSDTDTSGNLLRNYYSWTATAAALNYYTVAVRVRLPKDFSAWATSDAIQIDYATQSTSSSNNTVDVRIYNGDDTPGTAVSSNANNVSGVASTWTTLSIDDSVIDDNAAPDWDAADESAVIYIRLGSLSSNVVKIGDIRLNYLSSF